MTQKKVYNGNDRAKMIAEKLFTNGLENSRQLAKRLTELGYVESISHVTCYRWIEEFKQNV
tara:strand:- start:1471 stop:1653 length:183 start_codon:yes stop_codon:yes gene_type:complete